MLQEGSESQAAFLALELLALHLEPTGLIGPGFEGAAPVQRPFPGRG